MKKHSYRIGENVVALITAFVLVVAGLYLFNGTSFLSASILQPTNQDPLLEGDIVYAPTSNSVTISTQKSFENTAGISLFFLFNPDEVKFTSTTISSPYEYTVSNAGDGKIAFIILPSNSTRIEAGPILTITGVSLDATAVSDPAVTFLDGVVETLSLSRK